MTGLAILDRSRTGRAAISILVLALAGTCSPPGDRSDSSPPPLADAHIHLSEAGPAALDSLVAAGVVAVRDCGGELEELERWRDEIAAGRRRGPRIYLAGPLLDGPKPGARYRLTVLTPAEAERAVDSLADAGVDFIKTHNAIPPAAFFAVLRRSRLRGLRVAAHLPRGVPAWVAADSGVGSIEHTAESVVASPIYAGYAADAQEAFAWWRSAAGDTMIAHLARTGVFVTPTLVRYEAGIALAATPQLRRARALALADLMALTARLYRAGVPLLVGSDSGDPAVGVRPGPSVGREMELLKQAGIPAAAVREAASPERLAAWIAGA